MAELCGGCGGDGSVQTRPGKRARHAHRIASEKATAAGTPAPSRPSLVTAQCGQCRGTGISLLLPKPQPSPMVRAPPLASSAAGAQPHGRGHGLPATAARTTSRSPPQGGSPTATRVDTHTRVGCGWCAESRRAAAAAPPPSNRPHTHRSRVGVAIIGGGIGGLATAIALRLRGVDVVVYERDSHFDQRQQGYGLTMQQGGKALAQLGVDLDGIVSTAHFSLTPTGTLLGCYGRAVYYRGHDVGPSPPSRAPDGEAAVGDGAAAQRGGPTRKSGAAADAGGRVAVGAPPEDRQHNVHVPRQVLRRALWEQLPRSVVQWGKRFVDFVESPEAGTVAVRFDDGHSVVCDALVGADGIFSGVRAQKAPSPPLEYLGVVVVLGFCRCDHPLTTNRIFQTLDGETRIYAMPFATVAMAAAMGLGPAEDDDQRPFTMWQLSFPVESEASARDVCSSIASLKATAIARCRGWHAPIPDLLANTPESCMSGHPVWDRVTATPTALRGVHTSHVTMLGDAAHPMSPFKGQGANQALLDAVLLAKALFRTGLAHAPDCSGCVSDEGAVDRGSVAAPARGPPWQRPRVSVASALAEFEAAMLRRCAIKVRQSREASSSLHSPAALEPTSCTRAAAAKGGLDAADCVTEDDKDWARDLLRAIFSQTPSDPAAAAGDGIVGSNDGDDRGLGALGSSCR